MCSFALVGLFQSQNTLRSVVCEKLIHVDQSAVFCFFLCRESNKEGATMEAGMEGSSSMTRD